MIYDISRTISPAMTIWPGDPAVEISPAAAIGAGDPCNVSTITMGSHAGTHIDAPYHFLDSGQTVDQLDPALFCGPCSVVEVSAPVITAENLAPRLPDTIERLLIKTDNSGFIGAEGAFRHTFTALDVSAARLLRDRDVCLAGIDYLSVESPDALPHAPVHTTLLNAGIIILESIDLSEVPRGEYFLSALPLKIRGGDGAPCRAVLLPR
ncbi:MAG: cyclase family protein [Fibrobacterota bacterium]